MLGPMQHARFNAAVAFSALFAVAGCATDDASGGGGNGQRTVAVSQNAAATRAAAKATELLSQFEEFDARHIEIETYDEATGQEWLDFYDETFIPGVEELELELETMAEQEVELQALVDALGAQAGLQPKLAAATVIYISGAVTFTAVVVTWVSFRNRVVPRVATVSRKIQEGIDAGLNQAQAMAAASAEYIAAQDATFFDLQTTIAVEALFSGISTGASHCGKIAIDVVNIAGETIGPAVTNLFGKQKDESGSKRSAAAKQSGEAEVVFFLGESEDGSFENLPLGDFDIFVFRDGYVRGNVEDVSIQTCSATEDVPVTMATLDEFFEDDAPDPGPGPTANLLGSCRIPGSLVCDTWFGPELLRQSLVNTCNQAEASWLSGQVCSESGSYGACRISQAGNATRVLAFYSDPEWTSEELADEVAGAERDCLAIPSAAGTSEWLSPYRESAL